MLPHQGTNLIYELSHYSIFLHTDSQSTNLPAGVESSPQTSLREIVEPDQKSIAFEIPRAIMPERNENLSMDQKFTSATRHDYQTRQNQKSIDTSSPLDLETQLRKSNLKAYNRKIELKRSSLECEELHQKVAELSTLLQESQDFIFRIQPYEQGFTESDVTEEYSALCQSIESWVQYHFRDVLDNPVFIKEKSFDFKSAQKFLDLISPEGERGFLFKNTDEFNIMAAIMRFLCNKIFKTYFYGAIEEETIGFLNLVAEGMKTLPVQRNLASIRAWRGETVQAITATAHFKTCRTKRIRELSVALAEMLHLFTPHDDINSLLSNVKALMIEPAVKLADKIHLSADSFEHCWALDEMARRRDHLGRSQDPHQFECADLLKNGRIVKFSSDPRAHTKDRIDYLFDINPGLCCSKVKADGFMEKRVLKKPKILVAVTMPGEKQLKPRRPGSPAQTILELLHGRTH